MARPRNDIERYLNGDMTASEMHALEREALNDPFLAEALEGIDQAGTDSFLFDLKQLHNSVRQRTALRKPKMISMWNWSIGIAAGLIILALSSVYIISIINADKKRDLLAQKKESPAPVSEEKKNTVQKDSLVTPLESKPLIAAKGERKNKDKQIAKPKDNLGTAANPSGAGEVQRQADADTRGAEPIVSTTQPQEVVAEKSAPTDDSDEKLAKADLASGKEEAESKSRLRAAASKRSAVEPMSASKAITPNRIASGRVISNDDKTGLPGVNVVIKGTSVGTVTDAEGNYQIILPNEVETLVFSFIGLQSTEMRASVDKPITVEMVNDTSQLSEVVVAGYAATNDSEFDTFEMAQPSGGRKAFKQYLETQIQYPVQAIENKVEGKVTIEFSVDIDGQLKDFKVLKGIGYGCDEEVIRVVKKGPAWSPSKKNAAAKKEKMRLRYKFDLTRKK